MQRRNHPEIRSLGWQANSTLYIVSVSQRLWRPQYTALVEESIPLKTTTIITSFQYYIRLMTFFQDNMGKPAPERQNHAGF